jgi:hypothetical protein
MKKSGSYLLSFLILLLSCSFSGKETLKGVWQFAGGIYNGKKEGAPAGYVLQRKYTNKNYEAFVIDSGAKPEKYEAGEYELRGDTCIEKETYSSQPSRLKDIPVNYLYTIQNDTLTLKATLPSGMSVEEYWRHVK